ncbi:hypothetical protein E4U19_007286 [Claviceps sp. Clav32 group G5]|nr:hypothetical protein E4U19_007286 [Claviceps sp. Clav32 group G5]
MDQQGQFDALLEDIRQLKIEETDTPSKQNMASDSQQVTPTETLSHLQPKNDRELQKFQRLDEIILKLHALKTLEKEDRRKEDEIRHKEMKALELERDRALRQAEKKEEEFVESLRLAERREADLQLEVKNLQQNGERRLKNRDLGLQEKDLVLESKRKTAELQNKDALVQDRDKQLEDKNRHVQDTEVELQDTKKALQDTKKALQNTKNVLQVTQSALETSEIRTRESVAELEIKDRQLEEKGRQLEEKSRQLEENGRQLEGKNRQLEEKDRQLEKEGRQLEEKGRRLEEKNRQLEKEGHLLEEKNRQLKEKGHLLEEKNRELQEKDRQLEGKNRQLEEKDRQLQEGNSLSQEKDIELSNQAKLLQFSTIGEYLMKCHVSYIPTVQMNADQRTPYGVTKLKERCGPTHANPWEGFLGEQKKIFEQVCKTIGPDLREFPRLITVEQIASNIRPIASEKELKMFINTYVENPVRHVMKKLFSVDPQDKVCQAEGKEVDFRYYYFSEDMKSGHEAFAGIDEPTDTLQFTANGLKTYDREMVRYKSLLDAYKLKQHRYEKETSAIDTITQS